ncbi:MAG: tyrosine-type recombinase/integrase [Lachnospiraceae bacterium]|nr:tyrosine-type recombinase/integrase [Lachnospiraceae bacterium]
MNIKFNSRFSKELSEMIEYKVSLGYNQNTYLTHAVHFDKYCMEKYPDISTLTKEAVLGWLELRLGEAPITLQGRCGFIRTFARYLISIGRDAYLIPDRFIGGQSKFVPYLFTDKELTSLFHEIDNMVSTQEPFQQHLLPVIFRMIYTCGLRPQEGRTIRRKNVNLETGEILITETKRHKERIIVMSDDMRTLASSYCLIRDAAYPDSDYMFPNKEGDPYKAVWLQKKLKYFFRCVHPDIDPDILPSVRIYDLRHRFASAVIMKWLDNQEDFYNKLPYLRTYMGHTQLSATAYYIHLLPENLVKSAGIEWSVLEQLIPEVELWED